MQVKRPFFSIIIPVYNVAPYLRECLDSVLSQTFVDWEAICVDDGSTDDSGEILDEYASKNSRIRVIHKKNSGVCDARNAGLDRAEGEWIGFMDADDTWVEDWLSQIKTSSAGNFDWIRTGWTDCRGNQKIEKETLPEEKVKAFFSDFVLPIGWKAVSRCGYPYINFIRREKLGALRFKSGIRFREDALFGFELAATSRGLKIVPHTGYFRRMHDGSATYSPRRKDDTLKLLTAYRDLWMKVFHDTGRGANQIVDDASIHWVSKDVREWYDLCRDRTKSDEIAVWKVVRDLKAIGALEGKCYGSRLDGLRWNIYLQTGLGRVLLMNKNNLLGLQKRKD